MKGKPPQLVRENPHAPRKGRRGFRAPFRIEVCRWVVLYRLLGFDVQSIATVTGVSVKNVRYILEIFGGKMDRRDGGTGRIIWNSRYAITREAHRRLNLPDSCPLSVDHANGGPDMFEGEDVHLASLPPLEWKPDTDGYSDWTGADWLAGE